jgi:hypothetical protein
MNNKDNFSALRPNIEKVSVVEQAAKRFVQGYEMSYHTMPEATEIFQAGINWFVSQAERMTVSACDSCVKENPHMVKVVMLADLKGLAK